MLFLLAAGRTDCSGIWVVQRQPGLPPSSVANLILTLEPAFTAVDAYFLLGERLICIQTFGGLLIQGGVIFLRTCEGRLASPAQNEAGLPAL